MVHSVELFTSFDPSKMFNVTDGVYPLILNSDSFYTANLFLPLALLAEITFLPFLVFILVLNPCVLFLGVLWG